MEDRKAPCLIHFQNWFYCLRQQLQTKAKGELTFFGHEVSLHNEKHFKFPALLVTEISTYTKHVPL